MLAKAAKKPTRKSLVAKADKVFSLYIRARDKRCMTCGSVDNLTNGHVFSRAAYSTRWDEQNAYCQCWGCNYRHEFDPYPLTEHARKTLGQEVYDGLHTRYKTPRKLSNADLEDIITHYRQKLSDIS